MSPTNLQSTLQLIYEIEGVEGVIDYANHYQMPLAFCHGCGGDTPQVDGVCACCGQGEVIA